MTYSRRFDRPTPKAEQDRVMLCVWSAYRCMLLGTAGKPEIFHLLDAINIVRELVYMGKLPAAVGHQVDLANGAIAEAMGALPAGIDAEGLSALAEVCTQYDNAVYKLSIGTLQAAKVAFIDRLSKSDEKALGKAIARELSECRHAA